MGESDGLRSGATARVSTVLLEQSVAVLPTWLTASILAAGWSCFLIRVVLVRPKLAVDHAGNAFLGLNLVYPTLRESWVQDSLLAGVRLSDIRILQQCAAAAGGAALLIMISLALFKRWRLTPLRLVCPVVGATAVLWAVIVWTSLPTRSRNIAIEQMVGDWRVAVQLTAFCISYPIAEAVILVALWHIKRSNTGNRPLRLFLFGAGVSAIAVSLLDTGSRITGGILLSAGIENGLTERSALQADLVLYPPVLLCIAMALPSCTRALRHIAHLDKPSLAVRRLTPLWEDLTNAVPDFLLRNTEAMLVDPTEREHRMRIEIEDTIVSLAPRLPANDCWPSSPIERAAVLSHALRRPGADGGGVTMHYMEEFAPKWLADESQVDDLAQAWREIGR